jgi:hypothetical protein
VQVEQPVGPRHVRLQRGGAAAFARAAGFEPVGRPLAVEVFVREARGVGVGRVEASKASRLHNASVRLPRCGRTPASSRPLSAQAPHTSLPCTSALIITWRPGWPESKCQTPSVPVLPARQAEISGAGSSKLDADKLIP